jgi:GNAT superfamily N-acetyltransferase
MTLEIREAEPAEAAVVEAMLVEAAKWVDALGEVMWDTGELSPERIAAETAAGQFVLAIVDGQPAGAIRFQLEDTLFWPDLPPGDSAFVHRLVVRRRYKGQGISTALLQWAVDHARALGRTHLRLDCDKSRPKLRALYEAFGFQFHSFRQVGPYDVARYEYPLKASGLRRQGPGLGKT